MNKNWNTKKICTLASLMAITVILSIYATFRVGNQIKIPLKFITVFLTGALFGPMAGGIVGAGADILNALLVPVGPILPQITAIEFVYGFTYGMFFKGMKDGKSYYIRAVLCAALHFLVSIFVTSAILTEVGYFASYKFALLIRFPSAVMLFVIHIFSMIILKRFVFIIGCNSEIVKRGK